MSGLRVVGTIFVVAGTGLAIWVASSGMRQGRTGSGNEDSPDSAYDYQATDVVVTQMGPDGTLQYELRAKQITQQPRNGQISAQDLVMHRDPPGSPPDGPNRWTMRARSADLPESGDVLVLKGDVHANGLPQNSRVPLELAAEELTYNLQTQELASSKPVDLTRGKSTMNAQTLHMNIRTGDINTGPLKLNSADGTRAPK